MEFPELSIPPGNALALGIVTVAAGLCASLIFILQPVLRRYALARPNARSSHREPTPQGGGMAVMVVTICMTIAVVPLIGLPPPVQTKVWIVLAAAALIGGIGAIDDLWPLPIVIRLLVQVIGGALVLTALPEALRIVPLIPTWLERALLLLAMLWFVNLTNFMDGIDWMTFVEISSVMVGLVALGGMGALPADAVVVALTLLGAMFGFAPFNKPAARLFLGDVGSLPIGLVTAWLLILLAGNGHLAAAIILPLYYLADATITLLKRILRGEYFWHAHRDHFYQHALDNGMPISTILARICAVNLGLVILASISVAIPSSVAQIATLAISVLTVTGLLASFARARP